MITDYEREQILAAGSFLERMGYEVKVDEYGVDYSNSNIKFSFDYPPYENTSQASISFKGINDLFDLGWIMFVREQIKVDAKKKLLNLLMILEFVKKHYEEITDYEYCKESNKLVSAYVEQHRAEYEKTVQDFLKSCGKL